MLVVNKERRGRGGGIGREVEEREMGREKKSEGGRKGERGRKV